MAQHGLPLIPCYLYLEPRLAIGCTLIALALLAYHLTAQTISRTIHTLRLNPAGVWYMLRHDQPRLPLQLLSHQPLGNGMLLHLRANRRHFRLFIRDRDSATQAHQPAAQLHRLRVYFAQLRHLGGAV